jgi:transcriptional regulator with XRE-family HTH domain
MDVEMEIGIRIRKLRHQHDWTQEELAEQIGIDKRNISRYESGRAEPRKSTLRKLAEVLGTSYESLIGSGERQDTDLPDDPKLLQLINGISSLPQEKKDALLKIIDIVIRENRIQSAVAS